MQRSIQHRKAILEAYRQKRNEIRKRVAKNLREREQSCKEQEVKKMENKRKSTEKASEYKHCK